METSVSKIKYTFAITGDEADLLGMLIESLAASEGLVAEHNTISTHDEFHLHLGQSADHLYLLIDCTRTPDKLYNLMVQRLSDDPESQQHMATFSDFIVKWYAELRKAFFR